MMLKTEQNLDVNNYFSNAPQLVLFERVQYLATCFYPHFIFTRKNKNKF